MQGPCESLTGTQQGPHKIRIVTLNGRDLIICFSVSILPHWIFSHFLHWNMYSFDITSKTIMRWSRLSPCTTGHWVLTECFFFFELIAHYNKCLNVNGDYVEISPCVYFKIPWYIFLAIKFLWGKKKWWNLVSEHLS